MPSFFRNELILVRYPFSDLSSSKVRPAIIVSGPHTSPDLLIVPVTSRTTPLYDGEFLLTDWRSAGLNVPSVVKRGVYTILATLVLKQIGMLSGPDVFQLNQSLKQWFVLP